MKLKCARVAGIILNSLSLRKTIVGTKPDAGRLFLQLAALLVSVSFHCIYLIFITSLVALLGGFLFYVRYFKTVLEGGFRSFLPFISLLSEIL